MCVLDSDGKVVERFDVTHDIQALRVMVNRFRMAVVAIERGDGLVVEGIDRCGAGGIRCTYSRRWWPLREDLRYLVNPEFGD